jgi:5'-nucleotidase
VCNYDFSPFEAGNYIKPYVIVERAGLKIGVIGVLCDLKSMVAADIAERVPEFPMVETVQKYADLLKTDEGCDLVIALTHIGYEEHTPGDITDPILCSRTRNIDLFVSGHSHTFMEEMAQHENVDGVLVPIVQDGCYGVNWGRVDYRP